MSSAGPPLSPPRPSPARGGGGGGKGPHPPRLMPTKPLGLDSSQLKARLYATSEIHCSTRPALKVVRRKPTDDDSSQKTKKPKLDPLPALSAYQRQLHHRIHGPEEPLPDFLAKRVKSGTLKPLKRASTSPVPDLPRELRERQKSLESLRELPPPHVERPCYPSPSPPYARSSTSPPRRVSPRRKTQTPSSIVRKKSSTLLLNSDPNCVLTRYSPPLESLTDPLEIIERLKREPQLGFLYLSPVDSQKSVRYNPYNLRVVIHSKVNPQDYSTVSLRGVTRLLMGREAEFTELEQWVLDYKHFNQLSKIKTFSKFRLWKAFSTWKKNVRWRKMQQCKKFLEAELFILNDHLRPALLELRLQCESHCQNMLMAAIELSTTYTLEEFKTCHFTKMRLVSISLSELHQWVRGRVRQACEEGLEALEFVPDPAEEMSEGSPQHGAPPPPPPLPQPCGRRRRRGCGRGKEPAGDRTCPTGPSREDVIHGAGGQEGPLPEAH